MLAVIHQLDLKDNNHGIKDVVVVLAEFWNNAVKLAEFNARSEALADFCKELDKYIESKAGMGRHGEDSYLYMDFDVYLALKQKHGIKE